MKVNIEVDCTPDEARRFLGLPDIAPMQQTVMAAMEKRLVDAITTTDAQAADGPVAAVRRARAWSSGRPCGTQMAQTAAGFPRPPKAEGIAGRGAATTRSTRRRRAAGRAAVGVLRISGPCGRERHRLADRRSATAAASGGAAPLARSRHRRDDRSGVWCCGSRRRAARPARMCWRSSITAAPAVLGALLDVLAATAGLAAGRARRVHPARVPQRQARPDRGRGAGRSDRRHHAGPGPPGLRQLDGELGRLYGGWRERLLSCAGPARGRDRLRARRGGARRHAGAGAARSDSRSRAELARASRGRGQGRAAARRRDGGGDRRAQRRQVEPGQSPGPTRRRDRDRDRRAPRAT